MLTRYRIHGMKKYIFININKNKSYTIVVTDIEKLRNYFGVGKIDYKLILFCLEDKRHSHVNASLWIEYRLDPKNSFYKYNTFRYKCATYRYAQYL